MTAAETQASSQEQQANPPEWSPRPPSQRRRAIKRGGLIALGLLALFLGWAVLVPMSSAVVTPGKLVASVESTPVRHPTGGVVRRTVVADGDVVAKGDVLVELEPADISAELSALRTRHAALTAQLTRPVADSLPGLRGALVFAAIANADTETQPLGDDTRTVGTKIAGLLETGEALEDLIINGEAQLAEAGREISRLQPLARDGPAALERVREAERVRLAQLASIVELEAQLSRNREALQAAESTPIRSGKNVRPVSLREQTRLLGELSEIEGKIGSIEAGTEARVLRAPAGGIVSGLTDGTGGGVIAGGALVARIEPRKATPEVEFQVPPAQLGSVLPGGQVRVAVAAFHPRKIAPLTARISSVAADVTVDGETGLAAYDARATLDGDMADDLQARLRAGMPVEVYASGKARTLLDQVRGR